VLTFSISGQSLILISLEFKYSPDFMLTILGKIRCIFWPLAKIYFYSLRYIPDRGFDPSHIKQVSAACEGLCKWVRAMEVYDRVIKIVAPKKAKLAEAEAELELQMRTLNEKRTQLQEVRFYFL